jgi:hypothetical protein
MKISIILSVLILSCHIGCAQFDFQNNPNYKPFLSKTYKKTERVYHLNHNNDFELRFWAVRFLDMNINLFVLSSKDGVWSARFFNNAETGDFSLKEKKLAEENIGELWDGLIENNILSISNSSLLKDSSGKEATIAINDGTSYNFELVTPKSKRDYFYHCPKEHALEYKYIKEFSWVVNIIELIFKYCKLSDELLCRRPALVQQKS